MIRVLVADDDQFVRHALPGILQVEGDIHVVAEAADGREAVDRARRFVPDVMLMEARLPRLDGLAAAREIHADLGTRTRVVFLTTHDDDAVVTEAVRTGASGFLLKDTPPADLLRAVRTVASGQCALSPEVTGRVLRALRERVPTPSGEQQARLESLTPRERAVLGMLGTGSSNQEIGREMGVTEATVKGHVTRILIKLGTDNRVKAALLAHRAGLATAVPARGQALPASVRGDLGT
ncbi:response regulator transcription factor [Streptomyces sp. NPDC001652]|uniref:response regulator transcription factor n=1 Tax=Streptomyces sp. NPDC001652 TaxID=3154393 RepID=UPI003329FA66